MYYSVRKQILEIKLIYEKIINIKILKLYDISNITDF